MCQALPPPHHKPSGCSVRVHLSSAGVRDIENSSLTVNFLYHTRCYACDSAHPHGSLLILTLPITDDNNGYNDLRYIFCPPRRNWLY